MSDQEYEQQLITELRRVTRIPQDTMDDLALMKHLDGSLVKACVACSIRAKQFASAFKEAMIANHKRRLQ